ncbi:MAG: AI-2E family transporter [Hyphomicrobiaceae bacterium]
MRSERQAVLWLAALVVTVVLVIVLRDALLPFAVGAVLAYFLDPVARRLQRLGVGRSLAAVLVVGLMAVALVAALFFLLPLAAAQLRQLAQTLPGDLDRLRGWLEGWAAAHFEQSLPGLKAGIEKSLTELAQSSASVIGTVAQGIWSRGLALVNLISLVLVTPVVTFYLLRDWPGMLARIDGWLPREHAATIRNLASDVDRAVGAFVRGQGTICLILGALYAASLTAIGLRYGLVIGLGTGLLAFVPMVGWALGLVVALVVALTQAWPDTSQALWVLGIFAAGMAIDSALLSPLVVGQSVGLHPVWLMLALFVFGGLFGFLGVVVAVPVAAALAVLIRFGRDRYLASRLYLGEPSPPQTGALAYRPET